MQDNQKSPEQVRYIQLCAESKKLYRIQTSLNDIQASMSQGSDAATMMQVGFTLNQTMQSIREIANNKYQEKMALEEKHPTFKTEAQAYGKQQQQKREQSQEQSF